MPVSFDVNTITIQGATAIASATAGNKLIIDGCDATTTPLTKAQAVQVSARPASHASTTTSIALAGSTENHVYAYASFIQGETGQPGGDVHTFYLYGHMDDTPSSVFVIAICSSTNPVHLPEPGDVVNRAEIQFELTFSATDEVVTVADTSMYATRGEFLLLKNRTVTTHAEGDATTGEDQTIYGQKSFASGIKTNTLTSASGGTISVGASIIPSRAGDALTLGSNDKYFSQTFSNMLMLENVQVEYDSKTASCSSLVRGDGDELMGVTFKAICCDESEDGGGYSDTIGLFCSDTKNSTYMVHESYLKGTSLSGSSGTTSTYCRLGINFNTGGANAKIIGEVGTSTFMLNSNGFTLMNANLSVGGDLSLTGSVKSSIVPDTNDTYDLGSYTYRWRDLYSESINVNFIKQLDQYGIGLVGSIIPSSGSSVGDSNNWLTDLYATNVNATNVYTYYLWASGSSIETDATILPYSDEAQDLGSNDKKFYEVYAKNLHGIIDHPTRSSTTTTIPVGGIFFAALEYDNSVLGLTHSVFVGDNVTASSTDHTKPLHIHSACFSNKPYNAGTDGTYRFESDMQTFDDGVYQALSSGICDDTALYVYVLLIKVGTVS